jgi:hypothetical protein
MKTRMLKLSAAMLITMISWSPVQADNDQPGPNGSDRKSVKQMNRSIQKEVRDLTRRGYTVEAGAPAMEWQVRKSYEKEYMFDDQGNDLFIIGVGSAKSEIQNVARRHAVSDAGIDACMLLESKIMGLVENDYNNKLYSRSEYESLSRMKSVFSNLMAKMLPTGSPICAFVNDDGKIYDYQIRIAYSTETMKQNAKVVVGEILGKENDELRKKFERFTGLDKLGLSGSDE